MNDVLVEGLMSRLLCRWFSPTLQYVGKCHMSAEAKLHISAGSCFSWTQLHMWHVLIWPVRVHVYQCYLYQCWQGWCGSACNSIKKKPTLNIWNSVVHTIWYLHRVALPKNDPYRFLPRMNNELNMRVYGWFWTHIQWTLWKFLVYTSEI